MLWPFRRFKPTIYVARPLAPFIHWRDHKSFLQENQAPSSYTPFSGLSTTITACRLTDQSLRDHHDSQGQEIVLGQVAPWNPSMRLRDIFSGIAHFLISDYWSGAARVLYTPPSRAGLWFIWRSCFQLILHKGPLCCNFLNVFFLSIFWFFLFLLFSSFSSLYSLYWLTDYS
jgi:hypothetical protein